MTVLPPQPHESPVTHLDTSWSPSGGGCMPEPRPRRASRCQGWQAKCRSVRRSVSAHFSCRFRRTDAPRSHLSFLDSPQHLVPLGQTCRLDVNPQPRQSGVCRPTGHALLKRAEQTCFCMHPAVRPSPLTNEDANATLTLTLNTQRNSGIEKKKIFLLPFTSQSDHLLMIAFPDVP